jgi:hypothetical protein
VFVEICREFNSRQTLTRPLRQLERFYSAARTMIAEASNIKHTVVRVMPSS